MKLSRSIYFQVYAGRKLCIIFLFAIVEFYYKSDLLTDCPVQIKKLEDILKIEK